MIQKEIPIVLRKQLNDNAVWMLLESRELAESTAPGQFLNIKADGYFLRRPISVGMVGKIDGTVGIAFEVRGDGTAVLMKKQTGDTLDILGPLGKGFSVSDYKHPLLIGGGIGVPPVMSCAYVYGAAATLIAGFRNKNTVILTDELKATGARVIIATDDGSFDEKGGEKGYACDVAKNFVTPETDVIMACGPQVMLDAALLLGKELGLPVEISLEARMACGVGACLGCACGSEGGNTKTGTFLHVCKDGPVFKIMQN
jgi:dihydroorotate dehydrogenase electron transfer subunit